MNIRLVDSRAGADIDQDGPSRMALEDLAALRAVRGSVAVDAYVVLVREMRG